MDNGTNYGVINEQGFVAGKMGFNEMTKEEHDRLLGKSKDEQADNESK